MRAYRYYRHLWLGLPTPPDGDNTYIQHVLLSGELQQRDDLKDDGDDDGDDFDLAGELQQAFRSVDRAVMPPPTARRASKLDSKPKDDDALLAEFSGVINDNDVSSEAQRNLEPRGVDLQTCYP